MIATQNLSYTKNSLSVSLDKALEAINNQPLNQYDKSVSLSTPYTLSEYLDQRYKKNKLSSLTEISLHAVKDKSFIYQKEDYKLNIVFDSKPLVELQSKIYNVYEEHQCNDWDGYGAEPVKHLDPALQFATDLFSESRTLIESVDIIPENDGCLCFDWFKSHNRYINVSVESNKLIYSYKFGEERDCGETIFSGKHKIIEQIKRII